MAEFDQSAKGGSLQNSQNGRFFWLLRKLQKIGNTSPILA